MVVLDDLFVTSEWNRMETIYFLYLRGKEWTGHHLMKKRSDEWAEMGWLDIVRNNTLENYIIDVL